MGGGSFFGKVGSFLEDYEFDALVIDDRKIRQPVPKDPRNRLERVIYGDDCRVVVDKYIQGRQIPLS